MNRFVKEYAGRPTTASWAHNYEDGGGGDGSGGNGGGNGGIRQIE